MSHEPIVRFPVQCPICARETLAQFPISTIASALIRGDRIPLSATCHPVQWNASPAETEQIREYMALDGDSLI
jgi:hypothetical protein